MLRITVDIGDDMLEKLISFRIIELPKGSFFQFDFAWFLSLQEGILVDAVSFLGFPEKVTFVYWKFHKFIGIYILISIYIRAV